MASYYGTTAHPLAAVTGAVIAVLGYRKWLLPKNLDTKVELAEDIISAFCQARDTITWARLPGSWGNEANTREAADPESECEKSDEGCVFFTYRTPACAT